MNLHEPLSSRRTCVSPRAPVVCVYLPRSHAARHAAIKDRWLKGQRGCGVADSVDTESQDRRQTAEWRSCRISVIRLTESSSRFLSAGFIFSLSLIVSQSCSWKLQILVICQTWIRGLESHVTLFFLSVSVSPRFDVSCIMFAHSKLDT